MIFWGSSLSWLLLVLIILVDFILTYVLALFYPNYSQTKNVISLLGNPKSPVSSFFNIWLTSLGLLICVSAINFYIVYSSISSVLSTIGMILLLSFGIGTGIIGGLFNIDENKKFNTASSRIHGIGAGFGFMAITFIPLIIALISFKNNDNIIGTTSIFFFILSLIFIVLFLLSEKNIFKNPIVGLNGLWQRILLACIYMPLLLISVNFIMIGKTL